ncbi:hypothetical protein RI537_20425 [Aeromonas salmonicida]|uniref:hypothetical protein n=1 Tax=Aeromonas salmonicida TaxID=645 RepID=UPI003431707D
MATPCNWEICVQHAMVLKNHGSERSAINESSMKSAIIELISAVIVLMPRPCLSGKLPIHSQFPS